MSCFWEIPSVSLVCDAAARPYVECFILAEKSDITVMEIWKLVAELSCSAAQPSCLNGETFKTFYFDLDFYFLREAENV